MESLYGAIGEMDEANISYAYEMEFRMEDNILFREGRSDDDLSLSELENLCFPEAEAATRKTFQKRLEKYKDQFIIAELDGKVIGVVNGPVTMEKDLTDDMYENTNYHVGKGQWKMIFGVDTHPDFRGQHIASRAMERTIEKARAEGRKGLVLTCKENLIGFYERFGYVNEGVSGSEHGGALWYQMRLQFAD